MKYWIASKAAADLDSILNYIAERNPYAADRLLDRFEARWELLVTQPFSGRSRDDLGAGLRQAIVGDYLSIYRVGETGIEILRVLHGKRGVAGEDL